MPFDPRQATPLELAILVGLPGAGKSTFYRQRLAATHVHVSKDLLANHARPARRQLALVEEALRGGRSVAVDNTNPSPADRAPLVEIGHRYSAQVVAYLIDAPVADCLRRNEAREGKAKVPRVAIFVARKRLVPPERAEGFDRIAHVRLSDDGFVVEDAPRGGAA